METNLEAPPPVADVVGTSASETDLAAPPPAATVVGTDAADVAGSAAASAPVPAADAIGADFLAAFDADAQTRESQLGETEFEDDGQQRDLLRESPTTPALEGAPRNALATAGAPEAAVAGVVLPGSGESGAPP